MDNYYLNKSILNGKNTTKWDVLICGSWTSFSFDIFFLDFSFETGELLSWARFDNFGSIGNIGPVTAKSVIQDRKAGLLPPFNQLGNFYSLPKNPTRQERKDEREGTERDE